MSLWFCDSLYSSNAAIVWLGMFRHPCMASHLLALILLWRVLGSPFPGVASRKEGRGGAEHYRFQDQESEFPDCPVRSHTWFGEAKWQCHLWAVNEEPRGRAHHFLDLAFHLIAHSGGISALFQGSISRLLSHILKFNLFFPKFFKYCRIPKAFFFHCVQDGDLHASWPSLW